MRTAKTDPTGQMPRLICVFAGRTGHFVGFVVLRLNLIILFSLILVVVIGLFFINIQHCFETQKML